MNEIMELFRALPFIQKIGVLFMVTADLWYIGFVMAVVVVFLLIVIRFGINLIGK